jgi:crossover junction endodeoxyribonuclease RuvC
LRADLVELIAEHRPDVVVVERVFFQTNVRTAMYVGQASGCRIVEYSANEVKLAVTGYGSAAKDQVQRMVASLLGLSRVPKPPDAADALALALCYLASSRAERNPGARALLDRPGGQEALLASVAAHPAARVRR